MTVLAYSAHCVHATFSTFAVNGVKCMDRGLSLLKWQTGALVPSDVMDTQHPQSPVWPSTSFHTDALCTGPLRAKSKQQTLSGAALRRKSFGVQDTRDNPDLLFTSFLYFIFITGPKCFIKLQNWNAELFVWGT